MNSKPCLNCGQQLDRHQGGRCPSTGMSADPTLFEGGYHKTNTYQSEVFLRLQGSDGATRLDSAIRERDEARAMVKELVAEVRALIAPMNELMTHADGPEDDRVFPQYEFDALRTLIVKAEAMP